MPRQLPRVNLRALHLDAAPPVSVDDAQGSDLALVVAWLTRLHLLYGVPFNYLVPDERMLPVESLRFFRLDADWMAVLLDGAYSAGFAGAAEPAAEDARPRVMSAAREGTAAVRPTILAASRRLAAPPDAQGAAAGSGRAAEGTPLPRAAGGGGEAGEVSGFLLRSAVVAGWPGLEVRGYADAAGTVPLPLLRLEAVAPSLLLCLFSGTVAALELREPAEALHFGVEAGTGGGWTKALRYAGGDGVGSFTGASVPVPLRSGGRNVVQVAVLAQVMAPHVWPPPAPSLSAFTAAEFALEMVEGVEVVRFRAG